ncbi:MAG: HypC/HybG/HupF family hydrogenase formation chaperone [Gammaproteobacteria bacterium]
MCLAIPMKIVSCDEFTAQCEAKGVHREVSLFMLQGESLEPGDHVLVHVGYAIQKVTPEDARTAWEVFDGDLSTVEGAGRAVGDRLKEKEHV